MEIGLILTIAGIILSFIGFKISQVYGQRYSFAYYRGNYIDLTNINKKFELTDASNYLAYISGFLVNDGRSDISKDDIKNQIKFLFNNEVIIKNINCKTSNQQINFNWNQKNNEIEFDFDLLKRHEYIIIESLLEVTDNTKPDKKLFTINGRIKNISEIKFKTVASKYFSILFKKLKTTILMLLATLILTFLQEATFLQTV